MDDATIDDASVAWYDAGGPRETGIMLYHAALLLAVLGAEPLVPGDHTRLLDVDGRSRSYLVHVPPGYDRQHPTPIVLVLHGASMNAHVMTEFCGLNGKADQAGFVAVYPNGTGLAGLFLVFYAGGLEGPLAEGRPNDVTFVARLLDDLATVVNVDPKRVYAAGLSNGGMMCYRLAAELPDRFAAVASVAGTMTKDCRPQRPIPILHFHGTADRIVPMDGPALGVPDFLQLHSVDETMRIWTRVNGCPEQPQQVDLPDTADDGMTVQRRTWGPGRDGAEVVLLVIKGGGHTWPGRDPRLELLGPGTRDINANDLIWEFFQRHPKPSK